jgi:hypothetical protein
MSVKPKIWIIINKYIYILADPANVVLPHIPSISGSIK